MMLCSDLAYPSYFNIIFANSIVVNSTLYACVHSCKDHADGKTECRGIDASKEAIGDEKLLAIIILFA
jgi:hypothetical protein